MTWGAGLSTRRGWNSWAYIFVISCINFWWSKKKSESQCNICPPIINSPLTETFGNLLSRFQRVFLFFFSSLEKVNSRKRRQRKKTSPNWIKMNRRKKSKLEWKSGEEKKRWNKLKTEGRRKKNEKREIFNAIKENMKDGLKGKFFGLN